MVALRTGQPPTLWDWLPDDTEESVMGTTLHQKAISILADMLESLRDDEGAAWDVATNLGITGFTRRDGTAYAPMPDVLVYLRRLPVDEAEISMTEYGPPVLVAEIASPSTVRADLGEKAATYARGGVQEYLVFDVSGALVPEGRVWARHLRPEEGGTLTPWLPAADGRWHSSLGFALAPEGVLLRVYNQHGVPQGTHGEDRRGRLTAEQERERERQLRREAERERQYEEQRRREAEQERQHEEQRRLTAEQRVAALEAELRRIRGEE